MEYRTYQNTWQNDRNPSILHSLTLFPSVPLSKSPKAWYLYFYLTSIPASIFTPHIITSTLFSWRGGLRWSNYQLVLRSSRAPRLPLSFLMPPFGGTSSKVSKSSELRSNLPAAGRWTCSLELMFSRMKNSLNIHAVCWLCCDLRTKNLILYLLDLPLEEWNSNFSHPCRHFRDTRHTTPRRVTAPGAPSINGHLLVEKSCPGYRQQWPSPPGCEKCPFCCVSASFFNETCINGRKSLDNWGLFTSINGVYICPHLKKNERS